MHASYYHRLVGFGVPFEAVVARELADFCERCDGARDGLWLALDGGEVQGSIAIDGRDFAGAHLRWFITGDAVRGSGLGSRLLTDALNFCDAGGHRRVHLWTFEGLDAARHLYEKHGFRLVHQQAGARWGSAVNEQHFERLV
ncbi:GNAT family N-acetyltransferase [Piscinibacter koreensis]|uniref:GNAT family N-acetyltransferase n=1 Tax=Piscinibacter koreensis TaxID=2742824 RepID=UPI001C3765A6|nr:GNAT family N-acetyltransferase [Schlegelella koreensis]